MIKTDPTLLVCNHTPGPWTAGSVNAGESFQFGPDAVDNFVYDVGVSGILPFSMPPA
jgi:hypothetical protein